MSNNGENGESTKVVLRDLQSLLRKSIHEDVEVIHFETGDLVAKGENYGSTMLKVEATIKRAKNSAEEKLSIVAKMIPTGEFQRNAFNAHASFAKEIYVFEKLLPIYRQFEKESGIKDEDLIDIFPKYYGGRLALREESFKEGDDCPDAALLMENLKVQGYKTMDRKNGMDLEHTKMALLSLARYHALGMALKIKKPNVFEEAKKVINVIPFNMKDGEFSDTVDHAYETICKDPRLSKYKDRIKKNLDANRNWECFFNMKEVEPWTTISHGDFWVNNMMFCHDGKGKPKDVKFIDFQIACACSPMKDLPYFLCASTSVEVLENNFEELLDMYHSRLLDVLRKLKCDTTPFSKVNFHKQLQKDASDQYFRCLMALKFFVQEVPEDLDLNDLKSAVMMSDASNLFLDRLWPITQKFVEKGWLL